MEQDNKSGNASRTAWVNEFLVAGAWQDISGTQYFPPLVPCVPVPFYIRQAGHYPPARACVGPFRPPSKVCPSTRPMPARTRLILANPMFSGVPPRKFSPRHFKCLMHGVLNIDKKKLITQITINLRYKFFKPN
jgi:hypothetical protein